MKSRLSNLLSASILSLTILSLCPPPLSAQVLEEIIVTAQRREQSLQEVPISIEVFSGRELEEQGIVIMQDLAQFSPALEVRSSPREWDVSVRGHGSGGPNPTLEQSAAMFIDGVHYGRGSMANSAFFDLERIEILRGPQPIHFGMNASAGAFNLITRKPGAEWEGNLTGEFGNFGHKSVNGGIGGPVTDALGVRVAAKYNYSDGYMTDVITDEKYPFRKDVAGRITLAWAPNDDFNATFTAGIAEVNTGGEAVPLCDSWATPELNEFALFERGLVPAWDEIRPWRQLPDCETEGFTNIGRIAGDARPFSVPEGINIDQHNNRSGYPDLSQLWIEEFSYIDTGTAGRFYNNTKNYRLGMEYDLTDEIVIESISSYIDYTRSFTEVNDPAPLMSLVNVATINADVISQELRVRSTSAGMLEWEVGAHYQQEDFDTPLSCNSGAGARRPFRCNYSWQDATWKSAFASLTFNFFDGKASIDVAARYVNIDKDAYLYTTGKSMIYDIDPDPDSDGTILDRGGVDITSTIIDCTTGHRQCGEFGDGNWTHEWGDGPNGDRRVPDAWHAQMPVAFGPELRGIRCGEGEGENCLGTGNKYGYVGYGDRGYSTDSVDPQIVLRYRPIEQASVYLKYAEALKAGGFDTGGYSAPDNADAMRFTDETGKIIEAGVKGTLLDGSLRYGVSVYRQRSHDLQLETFDPVEGGTEITQAGIQETKGIDVETTWAATDRLRVSLSGSIMDGKMVEFPGAGCTDREFANAESNLCFTEEESIAEFDDDRAEGTINRTGQQSPRTPDFKVAMLVDYWHPLPFNLKAKLNTKVAWSDDYIWDFEGFEGIVTYPRDVDLNISAGIGARDDTWAVVLYARNIFESLPTYNRENDPFGTDEVERFRGVSQSQYFNYGVQLRYNFN